jgi:serine/threonine-protein kinase
MAVKLLLLFVFFSVSKLTAQEKTFIREYTYKAGEMDSKISCRAITVNQLRTTLLQEIGTYVQSEQLLKTVDVGGKFVQDFVENISTISAGITKLDVLEEKWDGQTFWMKASITIDPKSLEESLKQLVSNKNKVKELEDLKQQLNRAKKELADLTKERKGGKEENFKTKQEKYDSSIDVLNSTDFFYDGNSRFDRKDYSGAIAAYTKVIEINPRDVDAYMNIGLAKISLQDYAGAIAAYSKAIEINPQDSNSYVNRGFSKTRLSDYIGAIDDFNKAIEFNPKDAIAYFNRGYAKTRLQDFHGAIVDCSKAIEIDPKNSDAFGWRGLAKLYSEDFHGAIADCTKAIEINPKSNKAYNTRGYSKNNLKDYSGAIQDFSKAIELSPNDADSYYMRGWSKTQLKKRSGCTDFSKAGELGYEKAYEAIKEFCN